MECLNNMSEPNREEELAVAQERFASWVNSCDHLCSGNCRREGCECQCGEWHLTNEDKNELYKEIFVEWLEENK